jgi:2,4-dienoyl-CoA reductase-like NADH-dependent reductase (Old Yellow Enzyme family)
MEIRTVVYEALDATKPSDRFMAYLAQGADGQNGLLPVRFMSETAEGARNRAIAFWNDEKAKKAAMVERGRKLGEARRKKLSQLKARRTCL